MHDTIELEQPQRLASLAVSAPLRWGVGKDTRTTFTGPGGAHLTTDHPLAIGVLQKIGAAWPAAPRIADLADSERELPAICSALLRCFAANLVRLHADPLAVGTAASRMPRVSALTRLEAAQGELLTTARHGGFRLDDDLGRRLIPLLDGTRDRAALLDALHADAALGREALERGIERRARAGLLLPGDG